VGGDICAICCGNSREQTVHCPFECPYLQDARKHEPVPDIDPRDFPNLDIPITQEFLIRNEPLLIWISMRLLQAATDVPDTLDTDMKEALEGLVKTYRTLQSGLVYQSRPTNPIAAAIFAKALEAVDAFRQETRKEIGMSPVRDADVLGIFAFLQRMEIQHNNGRRLSRAFVDFLRDNFELDSAAAEQSSLIV
jgi:hypothetical protein